MRDADLPAGKRPISSLDGCPDWGARNPLCNRLHIAALQHSAKSSATSTKVPRSYMLTMAVFTLKTT